MIILDTNTSLEVVLGAAVSTNELEFQATYADTEQIDPGGTSGVTNGTTDVTLVSAPSSGMRLVKQFTIYNADTSGSTVTIKLDDGTNERVIIEREIMPGETLAYDAQAGGFYVPFHYTSAYKIYSWIQEDGLYIGTDQVRARDGDGLLLTDDGGNGIKILDGGEVQTYPGGNRLLNVSDLAANGSTIPEVDQPTTWKKSLSFDVEYDNGTVSADTTIDWSNGNNQVVTLGADLTLSFSNMGVGHKQLRVVQDSTGGCTPTLPSGKWPGGTAVSFSTSAGAEDILSIYYNGTSYFYQLSKGWA